MANIIRVVVEHAKLNDTNLHGLMSSIVKYDTYSLNSKATKYIYSNNIELIHKFIKKAERDPVNVLISSELNLLVPNQIKSLTSHDHFRIHRPILAEKKWEKSTDQLLIPIDNLHNLQNCLELFEQGLLSFEVSSSLINEFCQGNRTKLSLSGLLEFLFNKFKAKKSSLSKEISSIIFFNMNEHRGIKSNQDLKRNSRSPFMICSYNSSLWIRCPKILYLLMPSLRMILTEKQNNIFTSPFLPDQIFIRIASNALEGRPSQVNSLLEYYGLNDVTINFIASL